MIALSENPTMQRSHRRGVDPQRLLGGESTNGPKAPHIIAPILV